MDAYVFQAALLCADCAQARIIQKSGCAVALRKDRADSDVWPQGPYPYGGGEADTPQHCDDCCEFLENSLTDDGYEYVSEQIRMRYTGEQSGNRGVLKEWAAFYKGENSLLDNAIQEWETLRPEDWA